MAVDGPHDDYAADYVVRGADAGDSRVPSEQLEVEAEERDRFACYDDLRARDTDGQRGHPDGAERTADGGWRWKGLELGPAENRIADEAIVARRQAEGRDLEGNYAETGITPVMRRIEAEMEHGSLVPDTEKFALKSPDRFKEKLAKLTTRFPDHDPRDLASAIHDGIRYTYLLPDEHYTTGVAEISQKLNDQGYDLRVRKPSWDTDDYRGVNTRWTDPVRDVQFEVQFHTVESWEAKQKTHDIYERLCDLRASPLERAHLEHEQRQVVRAVPVPPGASDITSYTKGSHDNRG